MGLSDPSVRVHRLLGELFPFHLVVELADKPVVVGAGYSIQRWLANPLVGRTFAKTFRLIRPAELALTEEGLESARGTVFILESLDRPVQLRGQMALLGHDLAVFLGSPVLTTATSVEALGLSAADFAPHDVTLDLIVLQQVAQMQLADLRERATELDEAREARDRYSHSAATDSLTGLSNRRAFWDRCQAELATTSAVSLLFIDVDNFKSVNDLHGHAAGDAVLRRIADALSSTVRPVDTVARLGGDEFAVLLTGVDTDDTRAIVHRVRESATGLVEVDGQSLRISVSIGVVTGGPGMSVDDLVKDADVAMYEGRTRGRGRVTWFAERMRTEREERRTLTEDLEAAVEAGQIDTVYQPIVRLDDRSIVALEALARWTHPTRGPIEPSTFIALAEGAGLIGAIDRLMIDRSLQELAVWRRSAPSLRV
ncbi:MAG: diguanylate cyclase, partial [Actinomycetota bacterium]